MKYDRNTAHTKRVKYDVKQPFTTGIISPGDKWEEIWNIEKTAYSAEDKD